MSASLGRERMNRNVKLLLAASLLCGGIVIAQQPVQNVNGNKHPNIAAAQRLVDQAYQKIQAARAANEDDMDGHAKKAEDLLQRANEELKQAALTANANHK